MHIEEKIKQFVTYLQGLSEKKKKIILWSVVGILGIIMGYFWLQYAIYTFKTLHLDISFPQLDPDHAMPVPLNLENNTLGK